MGRVDPLGDLSMKQDSTCSLDLPIGGWLTVFDWIFG